jgi:tetratricopeptide (TPR) repeat protein
VEPPQTADERSGLSFSNQEPSDSWEWTEYCDALFDAILHSNQEDKQIGWHVQRLFLRYNLRSENVFNELRALQKKNPNHSSVAACLGTIYEKYENYDQAADQYLRAAESRDNEDLKLRDLSKAAVAAARHGDDNLVTRSIEHAKKLKRTDEHRALLMETMARICEIRKDNDGYIAFKEANLTIHPDDHQGRSSLAYKCIDTQENDLVLYHYRMVVNHKKAAGE